MPDDDTTFEELKKCVRAFAQERDWEQFHVPKNLAMALSAEAGELMEPFLWTEGEASRHLCADPKKCSEVAEELADVLIYALRFADVTGIDIAEAILAKMRKNEKRYPVKKAKGNPAKYDQL